MNFSVPFDYLSLFSFDILRFPDLPLNQLVLLVNEYATSYVSPCGNWLPDQIPSSGKHVVVVKPSLIVQTSRSRYHVTRLLRCSLLKLLQSATNERHSSVACCSPKKFTSVDTVPSAMCRPSHPLISYVSSSIGWSVNLLHVLTYRLSLIIIWISMYLQKSNKSQIALQNSPLFCVSSCARSVWQGLTPVALCSSSNDTLSEDEDPVAGSASHPCQDLFVPSNQSPGMHSPQTYYKTPDGFQAILLKNGLLKRNIRMICHDSWLMNRSQFRLSEWPDDWVSMRRSSVRCNDKRPTETIVKAFGIWLVGNIFFISVIGKICFDVISASIWLFSQNWFIFCNFFLAYHSRRCTVWISFLTVVSQFLTSYFDGAVNHLCRKIQETRKHGICTRHSKCARRVAVPDHRRLICPIS